ncbi:MAG: hypothetical protein GX882_04410 [Methanomicrobiales archaeon]|nr:hypothetical protein [Methanomicrobiales archaeon]
MAEMSEDLEGRIGAVVDCILVDCQGDPESRALVARAILVWAAEHPDEWDELRTLCQRRHEAFA